MTKPLCPTKRYPSGEAKCSPERRIRAFIEIEQAKIFGLKLEDYVESDEALS